MGQIYLASRALEGCSGHEMGRALLAELYAAHAGGPMPPVLTAPGGKPCFAGSPWHFSISHTKGHVFCALADRPVGIDAEEADRPIDLRIAPKILSPGELVQFQAAADKRSTLLQFWVLKEAAAKLTGEGLKWHPTHTDFMLPDSRVRMLEGCVLAIMTDSEEEAYVV